MARNVLIVSIDSLRYDCCGPSRDQRWLARAGLAGRPRTPTLDRIGQRSLFFTNAFSTATYTTAAHASLFTGLYPPRHGVRSFFGHRLSPDVKTLAEVLAERSYRTFFMSDNPSLFEFTGLTRGFTDRAQSEDELVDCLAGAAGRGNVFAFAHFFDVHDPYLFSPRYGEGEKNGDYFERMRKECAESGIEFNVGDHSRAYYELFYRRGGLRRHFFPWYLEGIEKFDRGRLARFVERLERRLGVLGEWVVVVLSDHGEGRIEEADAEKFRHEGLLYDEVVRIVLMASWPGATPGPCGELASVVDVFPTVLRQAAVDVASIGGIELDGLCLGERAHRWIYAETWQRRPASLFSSFDNESFLRQRVVRLAGEKLLINGRPEAFLGVPLAAGLGEAGIAKDLLCRFEDEGEAQRPTGRPAPPKLAGAASGSRGGRQWRAAHLLQAFDLRRDPFEERPLAFGSFDAQRSARMLGALGDMMRIEARAVAAQPLRLFDSLSKRISAILARVGSQPVAIYGAGEHTRWLLARTPIGKANVALVVDSDRGKWGRRLAGFEVVSPRALTERRLAGVIISSHAFEREIYRTVVHDLGLEPEKVFRLYDGSDNREGSYRPDEEAEVARQLGALGYL